ncbi:MAG TPA: hypothetical protein VLD67_13865 [Vicinamibacterales bacterium]|nr:hypothetical protein [Vicinamibacterales bacterium]
MNQLTSRGTRCMDPGGVSTMRGAIATNFYREEFIRHRECLAAQREYFSEQAITDADRALARVLNQLEKLCAMDDADQVITQLLRKFNAVTGLSGWSDPTHLH